MVSQQSRPRDRKRSRDAKNLTLIRRQQRDLKRHGMAVSPGHGRRP